VCPESLPDRHAVRRTVLHADRIAGPQVARLQHPQVRAGTVRAAERLHPPRYAHLVLERDTRDAAECGVENQLWTDAPPLADDRAVDVDTLGRQVLAEQPVGEPAAQPRLPPVVVLPRVRVDGLVVAPVVLDVENLVTDQATVQPGHLGSR